MGGPRMRRVHFSPKAFAGFIFFLLVFGLLISLNQGPVPISQAWPILILVFVVGGTFAIYRRMWRARKN
jgi:fatty acid desaturase